MCGQYAKNTWLVSTYQSSIGSKDSKRDDSDHIVYKFHLSISTHIHLLLIYRMKEMIKFESFNT